MSFYGIDSAYDGGDSFDDGTSFDGLAAPPVDSNGVILGPPPAGIAHFAVPFAIGDDGAVMTVEQGSEIEVMQCVSNLIGTRPGTRLMVPGYGIPDPTFGPFNTAGLAQAAAKWEPRATISVQTVAGNVEQVTVSVGVVRPS